MEDFAKQYYECNPGLVDSPDAVYAVAFSILLLHTDAHNKNVRQKMNKDTFIMRTKIIEGGEGFPHEILDIIYDNIVMSEFTYADHPQSTRNHSWFSKLKSTTDLHSQTNTNPWMIDFAQKLEQLMPAENSYSYKRTLKPIPIMEIHLSLLKAKSLCLAGVKSRQDTSDQSSNSTFQVRVTKAGILDRKYDLLQGGKKATARGWRPLGVILSGSQIIFFADLVAYQQWLETGSTHSVSNIPAYLRPVQIISLSYAVCICDEQYTKYPHVFRLIAGDGQQFLMRAEDDQDMEDWMLKINYAATIKTTGVRLQSKSKESRREERARAKVNELSDRIEEQVKLLDRELQLRRNLMVFVPQQKSTKDRILSFSDAVGKRIKMKRIELQRLECYRDFLEAELSWYQSTYPTRKLSLPLPTHLCSFVQPQGKESKKLTMIFTAPDIQEEEDEEHSQPPVLPTFSFPRPLVETVPFTTDRVTRRRSQSNPVRPDKKVLLEPPAEHKARCRSGSVASSVQEDDSMSVVIINESEELLDVWHDAASQ
ncbi:hypothetical protein EDC96DRAFT_507371 [Choanephora cucurbitarum]|nr:hypothetical protein EDC96DRAFT_507371 [Choanephora cucurbitarum]